MEIIAILCIGSQTTSGGFRFLLWDNAPQAAGRARIFSKQEVEEQFPIISRIGICFQSTGLELLTVGEAVAGKQVTKAGIIG